LGTWSLDPLPLAAAAAALVLYGQGYSRLRRRRRDLVGPGHAALFVAGVLTALLAVISPLDRYGEDRLLTAHMLQHLLLADVAPLLMVLGLRGPMSVFLVPAAPLRALARRRPLRRTLAFLLRPAVSFTVWAVVVAAWHVPAAYDAAIAHPALHAVEHAALLGAGLLVWTQIVDPTRHGRLTPGGRALFAGAVLLAGSGLSEVLLLAGPLYPHYAHVLHRPFGFTAAEDQRRAGLLMMAEQIATLGTAAALLLWSHAERVERELFPAGPPS
jgi:cytochrome c oxidase assembly factor CtaG